MIVVDGLTKSYGRSTVVGRLSFEVQPRRVTGSATLAGVPFSRVDELIELVGLGEDADRRVGDTVTVDGDGSIRVEITKLRTLRSTWIALAVCAALTPAVAALILGPHEYRDSVLSPISRGTFALSALIAGILSATALANEFRDQTIPTTGGQLFHAAAGNLALGLAVPLAGVGVGALTQTPGAAGTVVGVVWLGVSNVLAAVLGLFKHYGIGAAQTALTQPTGHHDYAFAAALATTRGFSALLLCGLSRVQRTDI